ncbi:hypothetical protein ONZ43_g6519 [Nemania bipapillata]|uniref:Uncharacterized protein n=1 Tax=Nemania bipapillata TaxID=110536 RepID=A0ACC2HZ46_9PEZI|nr:hypothetical protein ONZ43_g6519 [Nemania bipapillata]
MACIDIVRQFCKAQSARKLNFRSACGGSPSTMVHFYEIWCKRAIATFPGGPLTRPILEANKYFGAPVAYTRGDYSRAINEIKPRGRIFACPIRIPNLTSIVVNANLQTMDGKEKVREDLAGLWQRCLNLPQELHDLIIQALEPFDENGGPPLKPTRILPPIWWKNKLFSGRLIPWLWDLDESQVERHRFRSFYLIPSDGLEDKRESSYIFDEDMWDWELLCRQLAQPNVLEKGGILEGKSAELWNRHRIWRLLRVARLGHVRFS